MRTDYDQTVAERDLRELSTILRAWYGNRDSDSVTFQNMRIADQSAGQRIAEQLVSGVQPECVLQLTVGATAIRGARFTRGAYDRVTARSKVIEPNSSLLLKRATMHNSSFDRFEPELHLGSTVMVRFGELARTLYEGGELAIVEAPLPAAA